MKREWSSEELAEHWTLTPADEVCVLQTLQKKLRCKEIWVEGAGRYRNPDDDLPRDFDQLYPAVPQPHTARTLEP